MANAAYDKLAKQLGSKPSEEELLEDTNEPEVIEEVEEVIESEEAPDLEETEEVIEEDDPVAGLKKALAAERRLKREAEAKVKELTKNAPQENSEEAPVDDKFKTLYLNTAAQSALSKAGFTTGTERLAKLIDFDAVEIGEDGTLDGLEDQILTLTEDFPELLAPKAPVKKVVKTDAAGRRTVAKPAQSAAEKLAAQLKR